MIAPFTWLIDTNVVSEMMRPRPDPGVVAFLDSIAVQGLGIASITVWEVLYGIGRLAPGRRRDDLAGGFHRVLDELFEDRVIGWTLADALECARIMEKKRRRGEPLDDHRHDAFLAGCAASRGLGVVTRNVRQFRNTGIDVVDPWTDVSRLSQFQGLGQAACTIVFLTHRVATRWVPDAPERTST